MADKERIINGSETLFLRAGVKSVTMDMIARELGMSKKTIYQHYRDKDELVTAVVNDRINIEKAKINAIKTDDGNMIAEWVEMAVCAKDIFAGMNPIVLHDLHKYYPAAWQLFINFKMGFLVEAIEAVLTKGIAQGYVRPDLDVKILAIMRVNQTELGFNQQIFPASTFNNFEVQTQFIRHFTYGISTIKGIETLADYKHLWY